MVTSNNVTSYVAYVMYVSYVTYGKVSKYSGITFQIECTLLIVNKLKTRVGLILSHVFYQLLQNCIHYVEY